MLLDLICLIVRFMYQDLCINVSESFHCTEGEGEEAEEERKLEGAEEENSDKKKN